MNNRLSVVVIAVLLAVSAYFIWQNIELKKRVREQETTNEMLRIAPVVPETKPANPEGVSPFDKPNVDPTASQFKTPTQPESTVDSSPKTIMKFDNLVYDFGRINQGAVVKTRFKFTNAGKVVLLISHAQASCGCTVPTTPKDPIKPGESNYINVEFSSAGKKGETIKTVTLQANTIPMETVLTIKATVIPPDK
jgi:hypothetical protein